MPTDRVIFMSYAMSDLEWSHGSKSYIMSNALKEDLQGFVQAMQWAPCLIILVGGDVAKFRKSLA